MAILIDNELQPKIVDFGLIRLLPEDKTHLSTQPVAIATTYVDRYLCNHY